MTGPEHYPADRPPSKFTEQTWTWLIIGLVLAISTVSLLWLGPSRTPEEGNETPTSPEQITSTMVPLVTGEEPVLELFQRAGCPVCHAIPGIAGATGQIGPKLVLGTTGAQRLADPRYKGEAKTVREYIVESILNPGIYIVPGYPALAMPRWYGTKISATALEKISGYLEAQRED
jgi:hypothetical protein